MRVKVKAVKVFSLQGPYEPMSTPCVINLLKIMKNLTNQGELTKCPRATFLPRILRAEKSCSGRHMFFWMDVSLFVWWEGGGDV